MQPIGLGLFLQQGNINPFDQFFRGKESNSVVDFEFLLQEGIKLIVILSLILIISVILKIIIARILRKTRWGREIVLEEAIPLGASIDGQIIPESESRERTSYLGWEGETITDLRPAGKGQFRGKLLDITANGEYITKNELVKITKHEGSRIVVQKAR